MIDVVLHPGRDRSLRRRHPWLLSGAVARVEGGEEARAGAWARVLSAEGEPLGFGHFSPHSQLRVRLVAFGKEPPPEGWLRERIAAALARRATDPLLRDTEGLRLVNAEGDGLPGLLVDRYRDVVVVKLGSAGMAGLRDEIAAHLRELSGAAAGIERADSSAARREGMVAQQGPLWGELPAGPVWFDERGRRYRVDLLAGQKTGFYLDQRDSRDLVQTLAGGRRVLDLFAYSGAFSVAAACGGARSVTLVDSSAPALELAGENLRENAPAVDAEIVRGDVSRFLREGRGGFELIVLDPPPLARKRRDVDRAARAYKDLTLRALRVAAPSARLLVFACSHHIGPELFTKIVFGASLDAARSLRVLARLGAPADHAVSLDHPEGAYLTGLLLET